MSHDTGAPFNGPRTMTTMSNGVWLLTQNWRQGRYTNRARYKPFIRTHTTWSDHLAQMAACKNRTRALETQSETQHRWKTTRHVYSHILRIHKKIRWPFKELIWYTSLKSFKLERVFFLNDIYIWQKQPRKISTIHGGNLDPLLDCKVVTLKTLEAIKWSKYWT